ASSLSVECVDGSALKGGDRVLHEAALVQRIRVDSDLHVHVVRDRETRINGSGRRPPVFRELEAACARLYLLNEPSRQTCIALAKKSEIHRKRIRSLEHPPDMPGTRCAGRGSRP